MSFVPRIYPRLEQLLYTFCIPIVVERVALD